MTYSQEPPADFDREATASALRIVQEVRTTTSRLPFDRRADFLRDLVRAVYDAVKFDPMLVGPITLEEERARMGLVGDAADEYRTDAIEMYLNARDHRS